MRKYNNNFRENQRKLEMEKVKKKKEIINKAIVKNKDVNSDYLTESENETSHEKYKELFKNIKKELLKANKEIDVLKNELLHEKRNSGSAIIEELKKKLFDNSLEYKHLNERYNELICENENLATIINEKNTEIENTKTELNRLSTNYFKNLDKLQQMDLDKSKLKEKIKVLKSDDERKKLIKTIREKRENIKLLNQKVKRLLLKISELEEETVSLKSFEPSHILQEAYDRLTFDNFYKYHLINNLYRKYKTIKSDFYTQERKVKKERPKEFGYIDLSKENHSFISLQGEEFDIRHIRIREYSNGDPVFALVTNQGEVDIIHKFSSVDEMTEEIQLNKSMEKNKKETNEKTDQDALEYIGDFKILIVTAKNGHRYKTRLEKHGLTANHIDPYEKSPKHVRESMNAADIVLMCKDAMPHYVRDLAEDNSDKFQFIANPNEETLVIRTKYAAKILGLL